MKTNKKYIIGVLAAAISLASCTDLDTEPQGKLSGTQHDEEINKDASKLDQELGSVFFSIASEYGIFGVEQGRADDCGYPAECISDATNAGDMPSSNSGYNWFSVACNYSDRNVNYANPYIRWMIYYKQVKAVNELLGSVSDDNKATIAECKAVRAWDYFQLIQKFAFTYVGHENNAGVPIYLSSKDEGADTLSTARQTVKTVYAQIEKDLDYAEANIKDASIPDKTYISLAVVYGLRARVALVKQEWAKAADYAQKAIDEAAKEGITPATAEQVSQVGQMFCSRTESNWMWAMPFTASNIQTNGEYETWVSQLSSLASYSYTTETGVYRCINSHLWNTIPSTDVRKGWWVDNDTIGKKTPKSPLTEGLTWSNSGASAPLGKGVGNLLTFIPYTNVKFGVADGTLGTTKTAGDFPLMRVEEMYLILAEAKGRQKESEGAAILENFIKTYRDPSYSYANKPTSNFIDEVWRQRRIELWGEGFAMADILRLKKPMVRVIGSDDKITNWAASYRFNLPAEDPTLLLRIPLSEINGNDALTEDDNNQIGTTPKMGINTNLRDGVTDNN